MNKNNIELELRAEIPIDRYAKLESKLKNTGKFLSITSRISVMFFGKIENRQYDIRIRMTNSDSEIVLKSGALGAANRIEISQPIDRSQFLGMVRLFHSFGFKTEVGERKTVNFEFNDGIIVSLVSAGTIVYIELECMSTEEKVEQNKTRLINLANILNLNIIQSDDEFNRLCDRLSSTIDWKFIGTDSDYQKLSTLIDKHMQTKKGTPRPN